MGELEGRAPRAHRLALKNGLAALAPPIGQAKLWPRNSHGKTAHCKGMSLIERTVQLSFQQRVFFTKYVFALSNPLLAEILTNERSTQVPKVLMVLDESLHVAQPGLVRNIEAYFAAHTQRIKLVCPPMILEGGERVKNSYFHVSEIQ